VKIIRILSVFLATVMAVCCLPVSALALSVSDGADLSYAAAAESMVLLKNDNKALPLTSEDKVALFGEGQIFTDGKYGGFFLMGRGSGYFILSETPKSPCDILLSYVSKGTLGGVYTKLVNSYKVAAAKAAKETDFTYSPKDEEYAAAAEYADKAIYIVNRSAAEGADTQTSDYGLNSREISELRKVCAAFKGKPVIVVLNTGLAVNCGFALGRTSGIYADAVITAPYMGIRGTQVLCETLTGIINPSGKTADTYAKKISDYPGYAQFYSSKEKVDYVEDIYVGYRYFDTFGVEVDFPFGYGLSYTEFEYSDITYGEKDGSISVSVKVTNTGAVSGKESVQIYYSAPQKGVGSALISKAAKELCGFAKTRLLAPGESEVLTVSFAVDSMASYDDIGRTGNASAYVLEAGEYSVYVGSSVSKVSLAGVHTEPSLRVTEQCSKLCEPASSFEYMVYDGKEKTSAKAVQDKSVLHEKTEAQRIYPLKTYRFEEVLSGNITLDTFLAQMSDEELCELTVITNSFATGAWGGTEAVAEKYGIPTINSADGPAGLRITTKGTGIPGATALACTWNSALIEPLGDMVGREMLASNVDVWLAPGVNIHRFPLCGRNFEYFSEDPYLSGVMAAEMIKGVEKHGVAACVKHFVANEREWARSSMSSNMTERALREIYLVPFRMAVEAGVSAVMTSYNKLNGKETAENSELLRGILRGEWGFEGMITTDWSNDSTLVNEIIGGNNVRSSTDLTKLSTETLKRAVKSGAIGRSILIENANYVLGLAARMPNARRLAEPKVHEISSDGRTVIQGEDYSLKHTYARFEISGSTTMMSYLQSTDNYVPWLEYTVKAERAGSYVLSVNTANNASLQSGDSIRVFVNGQEQTATFVGGTTGGWTSLALKEIGRIDLPAGVSVIKIKCADGKGCGNFDYFRLMPVDKAYTAISTPEELYSLMKDKSKWAGKYYLTADIDMSGFEDQGPIGNYEKNFTGVFDGMGHTVSGIKIESSAERDLGLFGKTKNAVIRSLTVNGSVTSAYGGAVVGGVVGTADPGTIIAECVNNCTVTYKGSTGAKGVGGIAGYMYSGTSKLVTVIKDCENNGAITCENGTQTANAGGITGYMNNAGAGANEVLRCVNRGVVAAQGANVGGIAGAMHQAASGGGNLLALCEEKSSVSGIAGKNTALSADTVKKGGIENCVDGDEMVFATDADCFVLTAEGVAVGAVAKIAYCDANGDGSVDLWDVAVVLSALKDSTVKYNASLTDANGNGKTDEEDAMLIWSRILLSAFCK